MNKLEFNRVAGLARLLEPYRKKLPQDDIHTFDLSDEDKPIYMEYFKQIILPGVLEDGMAFGSPTNDSNKGVGNDARAYRVEYYQLLMQCYRYLYFALSSGEVFLEHTGWVTADRSGRTGTGEQEG